MKKRKNTRGSQRPLALILFGLVLIVGAVLFVVFSQNNQSATPEATQLSIVPYPSVKRVSLGDSKAAFDIGNAVFLDVRGEPYYSQSHIPGAVSISLDDLNDRYTELDPQAWIITYCT